MFNLCRAIFWYMVWNFCGARLTYILRLVLLYTSLMTDFSYSHKWTNQSIYVYSLCYFMLYNANQTYILTYDYNSHNTV